MVSISRAIPFSKLTVSMHSTKTTLVDTINHLFFCDLSNILVQKYFYFSSLVLAYMQRITAFVKCMQSMKGGVY